MRNHVFCRCLLQLALLGLALGACVGSPARVGQPVQPVTGMPAGTDGYPWWNDAVFYEIFVRSFYDSDGDGMGDFNGITQKLDYLNDGDPSTTDDLGVTGIWLMPIHPTGSYHGYDVIDYYAVNPEYGSMDDFKTMLTEAHQRGIKVIIDLVLNHTSSSNPWFLDAVANPDSPYRDWYIFSATDPGYPGAWGQQAWRQASSGDYYFGNFDSSMPDLNYDNPEVRAEMGKVVEFWLEEVGVDGFRLDAARYLVEEGRAMSDTEANHEYWREFRQVYKASNPEAMTVGEVWTHSSTISQYLQGDELDLAFSFDLAEAILLQTGIRSAPSLRASIEQNLLYLADPSDAIFLSNHDTNRVMSRLGGDVAKAKTAATILLTLPGVPFIYYGEEIGMTGAKPDEDIRTPMLWSSLGNAGFSLVDPWRPANGEYQNGVNVAGQHADPASLLSHYRSLIHLRNNHVALRIGDYQPVQPGDDDNRVLAYMRQSQGEIVLVVINLGKDAVREMQLSLPMGRLSGTYHVLPIFGLPADASMPDLTTNAAGGFDAYPLVEIPANGALILQLVQK